MQEKSFVSNSNISQTISWFAVKKIMVGDLVHNIWLNVMFEYSDIYFAKGSFNSYYSSKLFVKNVGFDYCLASW